MKKYLRYALPALLLAILGIIASRFDLAISKALVAPQAPWAIWIERYGEVPGLLSALSALAIINACVSGSMLRRRVLNVVNLGAAYLLSQYVLVKLIAGWLGLKNTAELTVLMAGYGTPVSFAGLILALLALGIFFTKLHGFAVKSVSSAKLLLSQFLLSQLFVQVLKHIWCRVRFRDLSSDYSNFSPWYYIQGIAGNESFPSGHTALAWICLPLFLFFPEDSLPRKIVLTTSIAWGITVAFGRIIIGAHYLSDVLAATVITVGIFYILLHSIASPGFQQKKSS